MKLPILTHLTFLVRKFHIQLLLVSVQHRVLFSTDRTPHPSLTVRAICLRFRQDLAEAASSLGEACPLTRLPRSHSSGKYQKTERVGNSELTQSLLASIWASYEWKAACFWLSVVTRNSLGFPVDNSPSFRQITCLGSNLSTVSSSESASQCTFCSSLTPSSNVSILQIVTLCTSFKD